MTDIAGLGIKVTTDGVAEASAKLDKLASSGDKAAKATDNINKSFSQAKAAPIKQAAAAVSSETAALAKLIGQIDPTIAALDRLDKQQAKLAAFKKSGVLGDDDFKAYSASIDQARQKIGAADKAVHSFSLNNAMARRELGYLVKDLATGQYGRFEQSAISLANASGVMSLAFSGAGLAVGGVVAALGVLTAAYAKGEAETEAFNKALITTGSYAGASANTLNTMAQSLSGITGSQHDAAGALAEVAASGKFTSDQLMLVTRTALELKESVGQSIGDTIKQFADLKKDPVDAITKLNDSQHFLTTAVYEQIKALEDQGKTQEAAALAEKTYADSVEQRSKDITQNLGILQKAWGGVAYAAKEAWDGMLNIGRKEDVGAQIEGLNSQLETLLNGSFMANGIYKQGLSENSPQVQALRKQISDLYLSVENENKKASDQSIKDQAAQAVIDSDREADIYKSREAKRVQLIAAEHNKANAQVEAALKSGDQASAKRIRANESVIVAGINEQYKPPKAAKAKAGPGDPADMVQIRKQLIDDINKQYSADVKLMSQEAKSQVQSKEYADTLKQKLATYQQENDLRVASIGLGQREIDQQRDIIEAQKDSDRELASLNKRKDTTPGYTEDQYQIDLANLKAYEAARIKQINDGYAKEDAAREDWRNGAKSAYQDILSSAKDVAGQTHDLFTNAFDGMADALATFATTGKADFKGLVTSILSDLAKMEIKIAASKILLQIIGAYFSSGTGTDTTQALGSAGNTGYLSANAKGGVYTSPSLSRYSGQIVNHPTMFAFAKGAGVMGEAGPEAILPLRRGSDGKLGVQSGSAGTNVQVSVEVNMDGSSSVDSKGDAQAFGKQLGNQMASIAKQEIAKAQRPGGSIWRGRAG